MQSMIILFSLLLSSCLVLVLMEITERFFYSIRQCLLVIKKIKHANEIQPDNKLRKLRKAQDKILKFYEHSEADFSIGDQQAIENIQKEIEVIEHEHNS